MGLASRQRVSESSVSLPSEHSVQRAAKIHLPWPGYRLCSVLAVLIGSSLILLLRQPLSSEILLGATAGILPMIPLQQANNSNVPISPRLRFPQYGTQAFHDTCPWTLIRENRDTAAANCTILVRPRARDQEGMAAWVASATTNFINSRVYNCQFRMDYGSQVNLSHVLTPNFNWLREPGFDCQEKCAIMPRHTCQENCQIGKAAFIHNQTPEIPYYRLAYNTPLNRSRYEDLEKTLKGFRIENGMSCSLTALFQLAPGAEMYEHGLFSKILPTLRDSNALVMTVYIRTGKADQMVYVEHNRKASEYYTTENQSSAFSIACAMQLEQEYLLNTTSDRKYKRVVWMVVTDAAQIKKAIVDTYSTDNILSSTNSTEAGREAIPRVVLTTQARGTHTRTLRSPSTADFAQAFIDWYLIGESDIVVSQSSFPYSFETTAGVSI